MPVPPFLKIGCVIFANRGDDLYIATTFQSADMDFPVKRMEFTPVAFSSAKKQSSRPGSASSRTLGLRTLIRQWLGPLDHSPLREKITHLHSRGSAGYHPRHARAL
jgi:hypothetical protein